jgi:hypothetical protein
MRGTTGFGSNSTEDGWTKRVEGRTQEARTVGDGATALDVEEQGEYDECAVCNVGSTATPVPLLAVLRFGR